MRTLGLVFALALVGCEGKIDGRAGGGAGGGDGVGGGSAAGGGSPGGPLTNLDVYTRLNVTCGGCHTLTDRPYFVTLEAFENSIAYDPRWVIPGSPSTSVFMELLNGTRPVRMPPSPQEPFAVLSSLGQTQITIAEIEQWIMNLRPRTVITPIDVAVVRRKSAEQVITSLSDQLGREVCAPCDSLPSMQLARLDRARRLTAFACLAQLSLFIVTVVAILALKGSASLLLTALLCLGGGLTGAQFMVNSVWPALLSLLLGFTALIFCASILVTAGWEAAAVLVWLLWFAAGAVLLTMASTQRGQVRAVRAGSRQSNEPSRARDL